MGPGTLYGSIQRMLKDGLILETRDRADPTHSEERRRYYRLTAFGRRVLHAEARRLEQLVRLAESKHVLPGFGPVGGV
jgi:DNA-binding PadR family transcriptional regulator